MGHPSKLTIPRMLARIFPIIVSMMISLALAQPEAVTNTKHNLSSSGTGNIRAVAETQVCIFCHTPHGASSETPLWNRNAVTTTFSIYPSGGSMQSTVGQPNGSSRLCLSCHDGTAAIGVVRSQAGPISLLGTTVGGMLPAGTSNLGVSLTDDHPISFTPSLLDPEIRNPLPTDPVHLDQSGQVQCRSCHNPHNNQYDDFLVATTNRGTLCTTCHIESGWDVSSHGNPQNPLFNQLTEQACNSCHVQHTAASGPRLLRAVEENLCLSCHDGTQNASWETSGAVNMITVFQKTSRHSVSMNAGVHNPGEGPLNSIPTPSSYLPEESPIAQRHVECADCHNSHASTTEDQVGQINGAIRNVWGVSAGGTKVDPAIFEYQICFKCHGDSRNLPTNQTNKRLEFAITNASFHPVVAPGTSSDVPGLLAPWTTSSTMNCTDCHNSDEDGSPRGPHGSIYSPLLKRNYYTGTREPETASLYASCYECHDRTSLYNPSVSHFGEHSRHVVSQQFSCFLCHSSHGSANNRHLIRFDSNNLNISPSSSGRLEYLPSADGHGTCFLTCHDHNHNPGIY
ncbi:MAG: hypothetical protein OEM52_00340 [bacterium]|nr:hypothetical protein [bacterium]